MATQSLYRRYRPRRFGELRGQDHVVRALREAVRTGREGQAYLFSGPRGTGKTSSARILAKVLNCDAPVEGEPCCECESCLAVERGTSYDVHELDAASNNGVEAIRDLIEKASLGTPGRHKVYILDEVHMLSKGAEAALLKTLEEPPPHVVFVLATTDPQKVSDTIRSRTQHLHFHLLPAETLIEHVRWVAADAGLELDEGALEVVVAQGAGSARDALSALELMVATGGDTSDLFDLDEFVRAMIDHDPGRALTTVAHVVGLGHDPRGLTELLVRHLRDGFLSLMAPELVQLPSGQIEQVAESARELGAASLVRAIERLGTALVEMRAAPDARVVLEVALVQLTHEAVGVDIPTLLARLERLERLVERAADAPAGQGAPTRTPTDPATGRAVLGGRARRASSAETTGETPGQAPAEPPAATAADPGATAADPAAIDRVPEVWEASVRSSLKPLVRAIYSAGSFSRRDGDQWWFSVPNAAHGDKCETHRRDVEAALSAAVGAPVAIRIAAGSPDAADASGATDRSPDARPSATSTRAAGGTEGSPGAADIDPPPAAPAAASGDANPDHVAGAGPGPNPTSHLDPDDDIDPDELTDVPPEATLSPIDRLAQAFPGAELVDPN